MATDDRLPVTRDEQAVLDQLEQLQQQIEAVRRKRREANDAFDEFLKSFKRSGSTGERPTAAEPPPQVRAQPRMGDMLGERSRDAGHAVPPATTHRPEPPVAPTPPIARPIAPPPMTPSVSAAKPMDPPAPDPIQWPDLPDLDEEKRAEPPVKSLTPAPTASEVAAKSAEPWPAINSIPDDWQPDRPGAPARDHHAAPPPLAPAAEPASILEESAEPAIVPAAATRAAKRSSPTGLIALLALVALGAVGYFLWSSSTSEPDPAPVVTRTEPPVQQQPPPAATAPAAAPPASPAPAPAPAAEITTSRVAWVRVIVDGEIVREGELPAGAKLSFSPTKQFVVRAGDAGAVRVSIAGVDQGVVGRDGIAVTKSFELK